MNTHENDVVVTVSVKDMVVLFFKRLWIILLAAIVAGGACFAWLTYSYEEEYTSKATIFLYYTDNVSSVTMATSYMQLALLVVNDCEQILTSRLVINRVIEEITTDTSFPNEWRREVGELGYNGLKRCLSISNVEDSRVLEIAVKTSHPELSKIIVDKICEYGAEEIEDYLGFRQVSIIDEGTLNRHPSNSVSVLTPLLAAIVAGLLVYGVALLIKLNDNKVNTAEDVERYLELSVLGEIPTVVSGSKGKAKKGYY